MKVEPLSPGSFKVSPSDGEHERIVRLCDIYGMEYENVITCMFSFAMYMAQTRIFNEIDNNN